MVYPKPVEYLFVHFLMALSHFIIESEIMKIIAFHLTCNNKTEQDPSMSSFIGVKVSLQKQFLVGRTIRIVLKIKFLGKYK